MKNVNENLKINIILKNKNNLLANATISIYTSDFGFITIKGFQIWKSKIYNERLRENINIQPTGKYAYGRNIELVFIEDRQKWYELEQEIYLAYADKTNLEANKDEINIDKIPI